MNNVDNRSKTFPYLDLMIPAFDPDGIQERWWSQEILGIEMRDEDEHIELQRVYFSEEVQMRRFIQWHQQQQNVGLIIGSGSVEYSDWESFLHGGFEPFVVGPVFVVPAENPPPIPDQLRPLRIIPGRGFGTGSHATTRLTMELHNEYWRNGTIFDVGTGSGILSIQAALLGSQKIVAVDTDADSIENARENVNINGLEGVVDLRVGSLEQVQEENFALIMANIIAPVLRSLIESGLLNKGSRDATFLFSGILDYELEPFSRLLKEHGLEILKSSSKKEWCALAAQRK
jgi:ribosomal protein L11 methyltransferase